MEEIKTLGYDWEYGHEELALEVAAYAYGNRLYIGLLHQEEGQMESFANLTVNLPYSEAEINEAYIEDFASKSKLAFIKKHKLGKILPEMGFSGYVRYAKVAFDLERLAEFDPEGVERFKKLHGIEDKEKTAPKKRGSKKQGMER